MSAGAGNGLGRLMVTHVAVAPGPLAGPVLSRVVAIAASRADLSVDRLRDALVIADALAARAAPLAAGERLELTAGGSDGWLELRVGPLRRGAAASLLDRSASVGTDGAIERLATRVRVEQADEGDLLVVDVACAV